MPYLKTNLHVSVRSISPFLTLTEVYMKKLLIGVIFLFSSLVFADNCKIYNSSIENESFHRHVKKMQRSNRDYMQSEREKVAGLKEVFIEEFEKLGYSFTADKDDSSYNLYHRRLEQYSYVSDGDTMITFPLEATLYSKIKQERYHGRSDNFTNEDLNWGSVWGILWKSMVNNDLSLSTISLLETNDIAPCDTDVNSLQD